MAILYCLVARGKEVLAEHTAATGNFPAVTRQLLARIPVGDGRASYVYDEHVFHCVCADGLTFMCMADKAFRRRIPFMFLEGIRSRFCEAYGTVANNAIAFAMNAEFEPVMATLMERYSTDPNVDKAAVIESKLEHVKSAVVHNIDKVLQRSERLDLLVDKTELLSGQATRFEAQSRKLKHMMWWRNVKTMTLVLFVIMLACGGPSFASC